MRDLTFANIEAEYRKNGIHVVDIDAKKASVSTAEAIAIRDDSSSFDGEFIISALIRVPGEPGTLGWYMCHPVRTGRGIVLVMEDILSRVTV